MPSMITVEPSCLPPALATTDVAKEGVHRALHGLVAYMALGVGGVLRSQPCGDLFRTPAQWRPGHVEGSVSGLQQCRIWTQSRGPSTTAGSARTSGPSGGGDGPTGCKCTLPNGRMLPCGRGVIPFRPTTSWDEVYTEEAVPHACGRVKCAVRVSAFWPVTCSCVRSCRTSCNCNVTTLPLFRIIPLQRGATVGRRPVHTRAALRVPDGVA